MANRVVWFDLPVKDLDRSAKFYQKVLACEVQKESHGEYHFAVLEHGGTDVGGCLVPGTPSKEGSLMYFNVEGRIQKAVELVGELGGEVLEKTHQIGPYGYRAVCLDSEGNRIALHSTSNG